VRAAEGKHELAGKIAIVKGVSQNIATVRLADTNQ
jgi:hypothetical protein